MGLEQGGGRGEMWEKQKLCKSGKCYAEARGAEEAILIHSRERRKWQMKAEGEAVEGVGHRRK